MRYRILHDGVLASERAVDYPWWIVSEDTLRGETAEFGLAVRPVGPTAASLYVIHRTDELTPDPG